MTNPKEMGGGGSRKSLVISVFEKESFKYFSTFNAGINHHFVVDCIRQIQWKVKQIKE